MQSVNSILVRAGVRCYASLWSWRRFRAGAATTEDERPFRADPAGEATVVTLYLLPEVNLRLRPKLLADLEPGTRVVSNSFDMGDWKYEKMTYVGQQPIYFWTIPAKAVRSG